MSDLVKIENEDGSIECFSFDNDSQYRIMYFDSAGLPRSIGGLPSTRMNQFSKEWGMNWVKTQDVAEFKSLIEKQINIPFELLLEDINKSSKKLRKILYGETGIKRNDIIAFQIIKVMLLSMAKYWKELSSKPVTTWDFGELSVNEQGFENINNWLFRTK